jgi:hypothetical protein
VGGDELPGGRPAHDLGACAGRGRGEQLAQARDPRRVRGDGPLPIQPRPWSPETYTKWSSSMMAEGAIRIARVSRAAARARS